MDELSRVKTALQMNNMAVYEWVADDNRIEWSGNVNAVLALPDDFILAAGEQFKRLVHPHDKARFDYGLNTILRAGGKYERQYRLQLPEGGEVHVSDRGELHHVKGKKVLIGSLRRIQPEAEATAKHMHEGLFARHYDVDDLYDAVTKLSPKRVKNSPDKPEKTQHVLLYISIDNLLMMVTWYSQEFAERVMGALQVELELMMKEDAQIFRTAMDQFAVVLTNTNMPMLSAAVDEIHKKIQRYHNPSFVQPIHLRASMGSVFFPKSAKSADDILNKAFLALTTAKGKTADFYCDYQDAKREHMDSKNQITQFHYLQNAFVEKRIMLAYQPVVASKTGTVDSYECLLRMRDEDGKIRSAGALIPIAEKLGAVDFIDQYVLEHILAEMKQYKDIQLSFNVSNLTTDDPKWLKLCTKLLTDEQIANRITVEITETAAQQDMRQAAYFVASLQALGCSVALDDFGAGYTSFRQLKSLSVDQVKIDGSFIVGLQEKSENLVFIKTLLDFTRLYNIQTVAEFVETGEIAKILMNIGVDYLQGYYFGAADVARPWANERPAYDSSGNTVQKRWPV